MIVEWAGCIFKPVRLRAFVFTQLTLGSSSWKEGSAGMAWAVGMPSDLTNLQGSWLRAKEQTEYTRVH